MAHDLIDPPSLYDTDFLAWTEQQEAALRARLGGNALDWANLAEEIGDMGRSENHRRGLVSGSGLLPGSPP